MRFSFQSKNYPGAQDLTSRSETIGFFTSTMMSLVYMGIIGFLLILSLGDVPASSIGKVGTIIGFLMLLIPFGMRALRKQMFRKLDEEYARRIQNQA